MTQKTELEAVKAMLAKSLGIDLADECDTHVRRIDLNDHAETVLEWFAAKEPTLTLSDEPISEEAQQAIRNALARPGQIIRIPEERAESDLAYLGQNAFEFILRVNDGAGCFDPLDERLERVDDCDWLTAQDREEAALTGVWTEGHVYPCGSVSFYSCAGTDARDVVTAMADACRKEQARWRAQGLEPCRPKMPGDDQ